jgi:tRNA pseudouridine38-40 synthase
MKSCLPLIIGEKDFASFRKAGTEVKTTVRTIYQATLERSLENSNMIVFTIEGRGFMRYMVRNLVGALVEVGKGRLTVEDFENILNAKDRKVAPPPAPPQGLILKKVEYLDVKVLESYPPFEVKI